MLRLSYLLFLSIPLTFAAFPSVQDSPQLPLLNPTSRLSVEEFCQRASIAYFNLTSLPLDPIYIEEQASYFSAQQSLLMPSCRLTPATEDGLRQVYRSLREASVRFAVRAGGHSWRAGASNMDTSGTTVDLTALNKIELDKERGTVLLGPGARWGDVYILLEPHGLSVPGGRDANVGVAGFLLGGGLNWHSNRVGWAVDALVSVRVLLATGEVVTADQTQNSNLFWAIKGSGGMVGIVTEFEMRVVKQGTFYGGTLAFVDEAVGELVEAVVEATLHAEEDLDSVAYMGGGVTGLEKEMRWSAILANLGDTKTSKTLRKFEELPVMNGGWSLEQHTVGTFAKLLHDGNPSGLRWAPYSPQYGLETAGALSIADARHRQAKATFTVAADAQVLKRLVEAFRTRMKSVRLDSPFSWMVLAFQPLTKSHLAHTDNVLGFDRLPKEAMIRKCLLYLNSLHYDCHTTS